MESSVNLYNVKGNQESLPEYETNTPLGKCRSHFTILLLAFLSLSNVTGKRVGHVSESATSQPIQTIFLKKRHFNTTKHAFLYKN
jgi:hypothetical protein